MTRAGSREVEQACAVAREVVARTGREPAYMERFRADPVSTLVEAGMPQAGITDFLTEAGWEPDEVQGYLLAMPARPSLGAIRLALPGDQAALACEYTCIYTCIYTGGFTATPGPER